MPSDTILQYPQAPEMVAKQGPFAGLNILMMCSSVLIVLLFILFTVIDLETANQTFTTVRSWINQNADWYYVLIINVVMIFAFWLMFSRYGSIKLGADDAEPEFTFMEWAAMLFSAGVGIGILFYSVAEPIFHFQGNPFLQNYNVEPGSAQAAQIAMRVTLFHWGIHGWAVYSMVGLCLAYFAYRRGLPLTIRSALYPIFGERIYGPIGHTVDILAVCGTIFGMATTMGLGASQMNGGLHYLFGVDVNINVQLLIIAAVSLLATVSAVSGLDKGIKILSNWNMRMTAVLLLFFLVAGPTLYILSLLVSSIGHYIVEVVPWGFWVNSDPQSNWQGDWTLFYWGWWIAWGPFVGMFMARISKGRKISEYLMGTMILPTALCFVWLCIIGGSAMFTEVYGSGGLTEAVNADMTSALYKAIELLGVDYLTQIIAALATLLMISWYVTSADSGTLVICTLVSMGHASPPQKIRVFWGIGLGAVAASLLLAGGLQAVQTASVAAALPFSLVLIAMGHGLLKSLRQENQIN